jgi:hypothetical protein
MRSIFYLWLSTKQLSGQVYYAVKSVTYENNHQMSLNIKARIIQFEHLGTTATIVVYSEPIRPKPSSLDFCQPSDGDNKLRLVVDDDEAWLRALCGLFTGKASGP